MKFEKAALILAMWMSFYEASQASDEWGKRQWFAALGAIFSLFWLLPQTGNVNRAANKEEEET